MKSELQLLVVKKMECFESFTVISKTENLPFHSSGFNLQNISQANSVDPHMFGVHNRRFMLSTFVIFFLALLSISTV